VTYLMCRLMVADGDSLVEMYTGEESIWRGKDKEEEKGASE